MKKYDEFLLNKLIDSYEVSALYTQSNKNNQRIFYSFNKKNIPEYFNEESTIYETINEIAIDLEFKNLINILWKNKREGHIIEKITLNTERLDDIYMYLRRSGKKSSEAKALELLERFASKDETLNAFITFVEDRIRENKSVKKYFDLDNLNYITKLLKAVHYVVTNKDEIYVRELSIKLFKDSKLFESLEGKVKSIIQEFHPNKDYLLDIEDLFGEFNIFKNPSYVMIKGSGTVKVKNTVIDLKDFDNGIGINSKDLNNIEFPLCSEVKNLITIENLTTFHRYKEADAIILYLGGYHNEIRRELLKKLYKTYKHIRFYHWGDIDCGGFRIFNHLVEKTGIPFSKMNMDCDILMRYIDYAKPLTQQDMSTLLLMKTDERYKIFYKVMDFMLEHKVKLEQEIVSCHVPQ